jgi:hypothetical protein
MQSLPAEAAFTLSNLARYEAAVTALEQGRAMMFTDILEQKLAQLDNLSQNGRQDLAENYWRATTTLNALTRRTEVGRR